MTNLCLHVGFPKCASTGFQKICALNHSSLIKAGIWYPELDLSYEELISRGDGNFSSLIQACYSYLFEDILDNSGGQLLEPIDLPDLFARVAKACSDCPLDVLLLSSELLSKLPPHILNGLLSGLKLIFNSIECIGAWRPHLGFFSTEFRCHLEVNPCLDITQFAFSTFPAEISARFFCSPFIDSIRFPQLQLSPGSMSSSKLVSSLIGRELYVAEAPDFEMADRCKLPLSLLIARSLGVRSNYELSRRFLSLLDANILSSLHKLSDPLKTAEKFLESREADILASPQLRSRIRRSANMLPHSEAGDQMRSDLKKISRENLFQGTLRSQSFKDFSLDETICLSELTWDALRTTGFPKGERIEYSLKLLTMIEGSFECIMC